MKAENSEIWKCEINCINWNLFLLSETAFSPHANHNYKH